MPEVVEYNGFDETGKIGKEIFIIRVGIDRRNYFRPYIYNILHFGQLIINKEDLRSKDIRQKNGYLRNILKDPSIDVDFYMFPVEYQIEVFNRFINKEFEKLFKYRKLLVNGLFMQKDKLIRELNNKLEEFHDLINFTEHLRNYMNPILYVELFLKSYAYRMVYPRLARISKILKNPTINDYKVISFIDGGYPFCFWYHSFLSCARKFTNLSRFNFSNTPIFGISNGDEYFPVIMIAGNIATLLKPHTYPHGIKEVPKPDKCFDFDEFYTEYVGSFYPPRFQNRILFVGRIPKELQYSIPAIMHRESYYYNIYEPFRIRYNKEGSIESFEKKMGKIGEDDKIICGKIVTHQDKEIWEEIINIGLDGKSEHINEYEDMFYNFLNILEGQTELTNLDNNHKEKIKTRLQKIHANISKYFETL